MKLVVTRTIGGKIRLVCLSLPFISGRRAYEIPIFLSSFSKIMDFFRSFLSQIMESKMFGNISDFIRYTVLPLGIVPITITMTPIALLFDFFTIAHPDFFRKPNTPENHDKKVKNVQKQILEWIANGKKTRMCTGRPGWQSLSLRQLDKSKMTQIKIDLEDIIEIDEEKKIVRVEPGMKMGTLIRKLLKRGWTIPVVPELETLTVGGLINGAGLETSSHKYGTFAMSCLEYELLLGNGSKVLCSREDNSDIFYAVPMSHGTIGFLTAATIPLLPATQYIKVEYVPTSSVSETEKLIQKYDRDFVEGIAFDKNRSVVIYGDFADNPDPSAKINYINRWYKKFFYSQVESFLNATPTPGTKHVEYIPIKDYYFRHQRGYFWETTTIAPINNNQLFLYLFGWSLPMNFQLNKLMTTQYLRECALTKNHVLQDFIIPIDKLEAVIELSHTLVEVYPIWLCPVKAFCHPGIHEPISPEGRMYLDIGIYGKSKKDLDPEVICKEFERFCIFNRGFQGLYADSYLSRDEFRQMFNMRHYDKVREEFGCVDAFPDVYDKVSLAAKK